MAEGWRMWSISLLTIMLLALLSAVPIDITDDIKKVDAKADNDAMHSHDENVIRGGKLFGHNQFEIGNINVPGSVVGDHVSIGHQVNIDVQGHTHHHHEADTVIECKEGLREMFKSIDSNKDEIIDAMELLKVCHQNNIHITKPLAVRILTLPEKKVRFNMAKFCELLKDFPSTNSVDSIYFLLKLFDKAVDGGWSNWSEYGQCSKSCGGGRQTRTRTCTNPVPQHNGRTCEQQNIGHPTETKDCNLHDCGIEGIQANFDFRTLTPDYIKAATKVIFQDAKAVYDAVGALSRDNINYQTAIKPLIDIERDFHTKGKALELSSMVALDKGVRDASRVSVKEQNDFRVEMSMRKDVLDNIVAFSETEEGKSLEGEYRRFVEKFIIDGKRNGLHLSEEKRDEITKLKKRIGELQIEFQKNLIEDTTHLFFDVKDLGGIPEDLLNSFERDSDGKCKVTMTHRLPVIRNCNNAKTRQQVETAFYSRCIKENTAIIEEILELRQKKAEMLGYENHAAYILELNMAKNPKAVAKFLEELAVKLQPLWEEEKKIMLDLKEKEAKEIGVEFTNKLDFWDLIYYMTMVEEKLYAVDQEKLKEYFPIEVVTTGLMNICQKILGLHFTKVEDAEVWHEDVDLYRVDDLASGETLGFFYLDLYPREGKFGHAGVMQLQAGCNDKMGNRQRSVVGMITNFSKPSKEKPSLLNHEEVKTYFHEFGHVMHIICSKARTQRFFGTVERDFVEAPSQMLENWVWEEEPLRLMSKHYKDGTPLPKEMLNKLVASRKANAAAFNLQQIAQATFDQRLHTPPKDTKIESAALFTKINKEIIGIETIPQTNFAAILPHLGGGYEAQYYVYLWSEVYSQDMFQSRFVKEGVMNSSTGMDYRNLILAPGGSIDAMDMLKHFLKRRPTPDAFLKSKGRPGSLFDTIVIISKCNPG